jgi:cellobiose phosphorylase
VIPKGWAGFKAVRKFRGVTYNIEVKRAGEGNRVALVVDGVPVAGKTVPLPPVGKAEVAIVVTLS